MTNEQLCSLAREGDKAAEAALIENVLPDIITVSSPPVWSYPYGYQSLCVH